jgi:hypothetical protein
MNVFVPTFCADIVAAALNVTAISVAPSSSAPTPLVRSNAGSVKATTNWRRVKRFVAIKAPTNLQARLAQSRVTPLAFTIGAHFARSFSRKAAVVSGPSATTVALSSVNRSRT